MAATDSNQTRDDATASSETAASTTLSAADLRKILKGVTSVLADADHGHNAALGDLHTRIESLGRAASAARERVPGEYAGAFERIEGGLAMLAERIASAQAVRIDEEMPKRSSLADVAPETAEASDLEPSAALDDAAPVRDSSPDVANPEPATAPETASSEPSVEALPPAPLRSALAGAPLGLGRPRLNPSIVDPFDVVDSTRSGDADTPWDQSSAEALTRVYEESGLIPARSKADSWPSAPAQAINAAAMPSASRGGSPPVVPRGDIETETVLPVQAMTAPAAVAETRSTGGDIEREWLEERFAEIAKRVEQSLAAMQSESSLLALDTKIEAFETKFGEVLESVATRSGLDELRQVETHIGEIATHVEDTQQQLLRLETIEAQLNAITEKLSDQRLIGLFEQAPRPEIDIHALARVAAEQVSEKLGQIRPDQVEHDGDVRRIEELRGLLNTFMAERRQGEEQTAGMLDTMQQAMIRLLDRVDSLELTTNGTMSDPYYDEDPYAPAPVGGEPQRAPSPPEAAPRVERVANSDREQPQRAAQARAAAASPAVSRAAAEMPAEEPSGAPQSRDQLIAEARRAMVAAARQQQEEQARAEAEGKKGKKAGKAKKAEAAAAGGVSSTTRRILVGACTLLLLSSAVLLMLPRKKTTDIPPPKQIERTNTKDTGTKDKGADAGALIDSGVQTQLAGASETDTSGVVSLPGIVLHQNGDMTVSEAARMREEQRMAQMSAGFAASQAGAAAAGVPPATTIALSNEGSVAAAAGAGAPARVRQEDLPAAGVGPLSLRMAAASGDASAEFEVAARFAEGKGVPQDFKEAARWYQRSAGRGLAVAQYRLGTLYERGLGVTTDLSRARIWYARGAEAGNVKAMHNLAVLSAGRDQGSPDYTTAAHWFQMAADRGLADSQYNIAVLYETGLGVSRDLKQAYKWFGLAARAGDKESARRLELVKLKLAAPDIAAADRLISSWRARAPDRMANDPFAAGQEWKKHRDT